MVYNKFDIKQIAIELGTHFNKEDLHGYKGQCVVCGIEISQTENTCPECNTPTVWLNSKTWRRLHGDPKTRIMELEGELPSCATGLRLCRISGVPGFPSQRESNDWSKGEHLLGQDYMNNVINYVCVKKRRKGIGAVIWAVRIVNKKLRELPKEDKVKKEPAKLNSTRVWD